MSPKDSLGRINGSDGGASLVNSTVVSNAAGESYRHTNIADHAPGHAEQPVQRKAPSDGAQQVAISHLEAIRKQHRATGVLEKASELIESGWSKGTNVASVSM